MLSAYLEAQANLPYVDDSTAESPQSPDDNVVGLTSYFLDTPTNPYAHDLVHDLVSLTGGGYDPHHHQGGAGMGGPATIGGHPASCVHWPMNAYEGGPYPSYYSPYTYGGGGPPGGELRSRQNSYCSHASRWSYSSHVEQSLGNMRSASRADSNGTRSCRNSLLLASKPPVPPNNSVINPAAAVSGVASTVTNGGGCEASLSEYDGGFWPPDYVVSPCKSCKKEHVSSYSLHECLAVVLHANLLIYLLTLID